MTAWTSDELDRIGGADELRIASCMRAAIAASKPPIECSPYRATSPQPAMAVPSPSARQMPTTTPMRAPTLTSIHAAGLRFW